MTTARQLSFSKGELAEALYARVDMIDYATGLRTLRNFQGKRSGGVENRAGFRFCNEMRYPSKRVNALPFIFSDDPSQVYSLIFGDLYAEFAQNGALAVETPQAITAITKANPAVVTYVGADPANGDDVLITGGDMPEIIGRRIRIKNVNAGANTFEATHTDNSNLNSTGFTTYTGGASFARIYKIVTPYVEADVQAIDYVQSADVMILVHRNYWIRELSRLGHTNWTLALRIFSSDVGRPINCAGAPGAAGALTFRYKVTAVSASGEESPPGLEFPTAAVTGATNNNPCQITAVAHPFATGDRVFLFGLGGILELNDREYTITKTGANTFTLNGINSTPYGVWTAGGTAARANIVVAGAAAPTVPAPITLTAAPPLSGPVPVSYNVYKEVSGIYGLIGNVTSLITTNFPDTGLTPDFTKRPPDWTHPFQDVGNFPAAVAFFNQRLTFASTINFPDFGWMAQSTRYRNFMISYPGKDSDAVTFRLQSSQVNQIKRMTSLRKLLTFTIGSEWVIGTASGQGAITPNSIDAQENSANGSSGLKPLVANGSVLFVQDRGTVIRDMVFDWRVDSYSGKDRSLRSQHLFEGKTIASWAYQKTPNSIVWAVRSDGTLLGFTYVLEEEVFCWARHDTDGVIENVCVIPEAGEHSLYLIVKRTQSGPGATTKRYLERMNTRVIGNVADGFFVDSGLTYDGRNTGATTMTLSGGPPWDFSASLTLTSSVAFFAASDVGHSIFLTGADGTLIRCKIAGFTNTTHVTVHPHKTVPASLQGVAVTTWSKAVYKVGGLWHLEGKKVSVLGDGGVVASPTGTQLTVANGQITLPNNDPKAVIQIGLSYFSDMQTLDLDTPNGESWAGKRKLVGCVKLYVQGTRTVFAGGTPPSDDTVDPFENLDEMMIDPDEVDSETGLPALVTRVVEIICKADWNDHGRIFVRNGDPTPLTILEAMPTGILEG